MLNSIFLSISLAIQPIRHESVDLLIEREDGRYEIIASFKREFSLMMMRLILIETANNGDEDIIKSYFE